MENSGNMFISILSNEDRGQSSNNNNNHSWDNIRALNHSRVDLGNSSSLYITAATAAQATDMPYADSNTDHGLLFPHSLHHHHHHQHHNQSLYAGDGSNLHPDPHLMCLKLGKRHYFEDATALADRHVAGISMVKKSKPHYTFAGGVVGPSSSPVLVSSTATMPRCQVEGCHVALINAKDYHRRHKVCEMHSKAPKVMVLGLEQRFCQQCSRFHVMSEFDDSKRSCRRRLAGHNERRRKSSHDSLSRSSSQVSKLMSGRFPSLTGRALSLLSSKAANSWVSSADLSSRCSAALGELIAENRASILARHLILDRDWNLHHTAEDPGEAHQTGSNSLTNNQRQMLNEPQSWGGYQKTGAHVTLDLMQAPGGEFGYLSMRGKTNKEEECTALWSSLEGDNVG